MNVVTKGLAWNLKVVTNGLAWSFKNDLVIERRKENEWTAVEIDAVTLIN